MKRGHFVHGYSIGKTRRMMYLPSEHSTGEFQRVMALERRKNELKSKANRLKSKQPLREVKSKPNEKQKKKGKTTQVVQAPSAKFTKNISLGPIMGVVNAGKAAWDFAESFVVSNKELIAAVGGNGTADFLEKILVNPGDTIFELLSQEAAGFTQYVVEKLDFEYHPQVPTDTAGSVMLALDYDVNDDPDYGFMTSDEVEKHISTNKGAVTTPAWDTVKAKGDTKAIMSSGDRKMVLSDPVPIADLENFDACQLLIKGSGLPTSAVSGKVWCDYRIRFFEPKLNLPRAFGITDMVTSGNVNPGYAGAATNLLFKSGDTILVNPHRLVIDDIGSIYGIRLPVGRWRLTVRGEHEIVNDASAIGSIDFIVQLKTRSYIARTGSSATTTLNTQRYKINYQFVSSEVTTHPFIFDYYLEVVSDDVTEGNDLLWLFTCASTVLLNTGLNTIKQIQCLLQPI
jgi:hypothetical protein